MTRRGLILFLFILACGPKGPDLTLPMVDTSTMEGQVAAKIEAARQKVLERSESASSWGRLGMIYQAHALDDPAVHCYLEAAERAPTEYRWPYLAAMAKRNLDLEGALDLFAQAIEQQPKKPAVHVHYGDLLLQLGQLESSEQQYRRALDLKPETSHALFGLAQIALAQKKPDDAAEALEEAVLLSPSHGEAQALLSRVYQQRGETEKAERQGLLAQIYPDATVTDDPVLEEMRSEAVSSRSYTQRGLRLVEAERFTDAEIAFRKVLEIRPGTARDLANVGAALARQGKLDEAIEFYQQALEVEPEDPYTLNSLAMAWAEQGRVDEAMAQLTRVAEIDAAYAEPRYNLGLLKDRQGDHLAAIDQYRQALQIDPVLRDARNNLGTSLAAQGDLEAAISAWREALWLRPKDLTVLYNLSAALADQGDYGGAVELLRRAQKLAPNSSRISSLLAWQLATAPDDSLRDGAEATRLARRIYEAYPAQGSSADVLAAALAEAGNFVEATEIAEKGLQAARRAGDATLIKGLTERLFLYRLEQPHRQSTAS